MQQEFRYVYQVYKEGSISKAAKTLYITQPALSIAIQKIEESIGLPLFDRSRHPLALTPAGQIYIDAIEKVKNIDKELEQQIQDIKNLSSGHICMGGSHYLNAYILPEILAQFSKKNPGIELELVEHSAATLSAMLSAHELDLTFSCNEEFMEDFEKYPAFTDYILLAVQEDQEINKAMEKFALTPEDISNGRHLLETCPSVSLEQFREMEYILLSEGNNLHERSMRMFHEAGYEPDIIMENAQLVTAYHLTEHFPAATFVSDRLVRNSQARLKYYKLNYECAEREFYILLPKQNYIPVAVKAFIDYFRENI